MADDALTTCARALGGPATYVGVPAGPHPRLLVPARPRAATTALVRRNADAGVARTMLRWGAGLTAPVWNNPALAGPLELEADGDGGLPALLAEHLGREVCCSLSLGTPRVNRKPVLQVLDLQGRTVAWAKVGWTGRTAEAVAAETAALSRLAGRRWTWLEVPRVLGRLEWQGWPVLVMSPVALPLLPRRASRPPWRAMSELATSLAAPATTLARSPWTARCRAAPTVGDTGDRLRAALGALVRRSGDTVVAHGAWHGDWTPWNMVRSGQKVGLWDWERFEDEVPLGLDACHFSVNQATRRRGVTHEVVRAALEPWNGVGPVGDTVATAYLVAVVTRYLDLVDEPGGDRLEQRASLLLDVLEERLDAPRVTGAGG